MPRLTLEDKAEKKFPLSGYESDKEKRSILSMRKAWVNLEQVKAEKKAKQKQEADKEALALGRAIKKALPYLSLQHVSDAITAYDLMFRLEEIADGGYWSDIDNRWEWTTGSPREVYELLRHVEEVTQSDNSTNTFGEN